MPLDPQCQQLVQQFEAMQLPAWADMTPDEGRALSKSFVSLMGEPEEVAAVEDRRIAGPAGTIGVRIFTPAGGGSGPLPVLLYYHGGGFVFGDLDLVDPITRRLANRSGCIVVSVDYRLAPEHPFPAAAEDAYAALSWVAEHAPEIGGDPTRIAVSGDSAGGNLSASVSMMARDRGGPPVAFQVLIYPAVDSSLSQPSYTENADAPILTRRDVEYFWGHYMSGGGDRTDPRVAPGLVDDLSGLPPAFVITAECDPLRDEGEDYGRRLNEAGVKTEVRRYDGMFHGFVWMPAAIDRGAEALDEIGAAVRSALGGTG